MFTTTYHSKESLDNNIDGSLLQDFIIEKVISTNEPQREIWLSCCIGGDEANLAYNQPYSLKLEGKLNIPALVHAVKDLITRHEALRSVISEDGESLIVYKNFPIQIQIKDISILDPVDRDNRFCGYLKKDVDEPFDLQKGPLFRASIHKFTEYLHYFTFTIHHIIGDGWSIGVICEDLSKLYTAYALNEDPRLEAASQLSELILDEVEHKSSLEHKKIEDFWLNSFKDIVPTMDIPTDYVRNTSRTYKSLRSDYILPLKLTKGLRLLSVRSECSIATLMISAFEILLYKISNQKDTLIGLPTAGQLASGYLDMVGHCVNLLPIKSSIHTSSPFIDYLKKRKVDLLAAFDNQQLTFGELIKKLHISRNQSRPTFIPVVLNIDMATSHGISFSGLNHTLISHPRSHENFEIFLNIVNSESEITFEWAFNKSLYKPNTIFKFHEEYVEILKKIVEDPFMLVEKLVFKIDENRSHRPSDKSILDLLSESTLKHSGNKAILCETRSISYQELNTKTDQLAHFLLDKGVVRGDAVAIEVNRSIDMIIGLIAILKAGAVYVPIETDLPIERNNYVLDNVGAKILFCSEDQTGIYKHNVKKIKLKDAISESTHYVGRTLIRESGINDLVYILHTSGSTGVPKGVSMTHSALVNLLLWQKDASKANSESKTLQFSSLGFDVSFQEIFSTLTTGGTLVLISDEHRLDPSILLRIIKSKVIDRIFMPFVAVQSLIENAVARDDYPFCLREVITAGEQLKVTPQIRTFFKKLPRCRLYNQYGPTETHVVTESELSGDPDLWPNLPSIGKVIDNTNIYILDNSLKPVDNGEVGELCVEGICLAHGYLNLPELTSEKFILWKNKEGITKRIYRTGDLARLQPDGNIEFLGREDQQVKIRGYRVELGEIEAQLNKIHPIKQSVVKVQEDNNGNKRLIAYLVLSNNVSDEHHAERVKKWKEILKRSLPVYMIPQKFVELGEMPLSPNGKIDRLALPHIVTFVNSSSLSARVPKSRNEELLHEIWCEVLDLKNVRTDDNFFELGGHSLLAVKIILAIKEKIGVSLPLATLFENSTIEKLAKIISNNEKKALWKLLVPIKTTGTKAPLYLIHGLGLNVLVFEPLRKYMDSLQPIYAIQGAGLDGNMESIPDNFEALASLYVSKIIDNDPVGPYILAGYSSGGALAHEMARQLVSLKKRVETLVVIDSSADYSEFKFPKFPKSFKECKSAFKKIVFVSNSYLRSPRKTFEYHNQILKAGLDLLTKTDSTLGGKSIYDIHYSLFCNRNLKPLDVKIDLLKAKERVNYVSANEEYGWDRLTQRDVAIHEIPGDHHNCLLEPNVKELGKILQNVINNNSPA